MRVVWRNDCYEKFFADWLDDGQTGSMAAALAWRDREVRRVALTLRYKSVTRIDHPAKRTFGYFVRVTWKSTLRQKFFSDLTIGDRLAALQAALVWRDEVEAELGKPRTEDALVGVINPASNTGVPGVSRTTNGGREVLQATWRDAEGRVRRTSFSIAKHGVDGAMQLARAAIEAGR